MTIERRWREGGGDPTDERIGGTLRQVADPAPLAEGRLDRVAARLQARIDGRPRRRRWPLRAAVMAAVLGTGSAVFARHELVRWWGAVTGRIEQVAPAEKARPRVVIVRSARVNGGVDLEGATPPSQPPPRQTAVEEPGPSPAPSAAWGRLGGGRRTSPIAAPATSAVSVAADPPSIDPPGATPPTQPPPRADARGRGPIAMPSADLLAPVPVSGPIAAPAAPAVRPAANLGDEARLLRRAIEELRQERDPLEALAALDEHRARFPAGVLRADADVLRVEVLLALDRDQDALRLLERLDLAATPRGAELQVTRGELRAARDCAGALADFEHVLGTSVPAPLAERARRGREVCTLRLQAPR